MSELNTYRVTAKCTVKIYQVFSAIDADDAVRLALDAVDEWDVWSFDEDEVKRVVEVENLG
jgi:hypothetical protein